MNSIKFNMKTYTKEKKKTYTKSQLNLVVSVIMINFISIPNM